MIYNNSILRKELKESYYEHSISIRNRYKYALFLSLISFGVHFIALTLTKSILSDIAPKYMNTSYFSVLSIYIDVFYFFYVIYLSTNYQFLTFADIYSNKWYILVKFGFSPVKMIFTKLYARLITVFTVYTTGFLATLFLTTFLRYPFIYQYIIPLYILGLFDIVFIITVTMTSSLYFRSSTISNYIMIISVFSLVVLKHLLGYYELIKNRIHFDSINVLFYFSKYIVLLALIIIACIITIFIRAKINAKYYYFSFYFKDLDFSDNVKITMGPNSKSRNKTTKEYQVKKNNKLASKLLNGLLISLISLCIIFNILVLFVSLSTSMRELSFLKIIPYVFHSETMQPAIMYNDLTFFVKTVPDDPLSAGDIVLYHAHEEANVARIESFKAKTLVVDIDNYPLQNRTSAYREEITRSQIYGKYAGRSRWLGVLILFSNTTVGRLLLLLIPTILLFFHKSITEFLKFIMNEHKE